MPYFYPETTPRARMTIRIRISTFLFAYIGTLFALFAQPQEYPPTTEMRGVWIATVANIDWPSKPGLSVEQMNTEFDSILDVLKAMNMNAVFVQVRPAGDAFYRSANIPWSKYLTGKQGTAPGDSTYDPMTHMIKAAHERRMEFHAWLNPYRATFDLDTASLSPKHPLRWLPKERKRQWFFRYGNKYYFNPANPLVRQYLTNVVKDIVLRYDVDGIHFDDYFYPYKEAGQNLDDYDEFAADPRGFGNIDDWRRDNVSQLIKSVSETVRQYKSFVRFGIGPFGVWRNRDKDPLNGSDTRAGITCYDDLYADVLFWLKNGWIDYVAPQLYWSIGFPPADYQKLVDWWSKHLYGRQLYIGHAAYKINNAPNDPNWTEPDQVNKQIALNRATPNVAGSMFYSAKSLLRNPLGIQDSLIVGHFKFPALVPSLASMANVTPVTPKICRVKGDENMVQLTWNTCETIQGEQAPYYFGVYRFDGEQIGDFKDPRALLNITAFDNEKWVYEDQTAIAGEYYTYVVRAFNRANVEGYSSEPVYVKKTETKAKKKRKFWKYLL
jgi:uncharacterized lipoprotein YddW (UPF0748 family)